MIESFERIEFCRCLVGLKVANGTILEDSVVRQVQKREMGIEF